MKKKTQNNGEKRNEDKSFTRKNYGDLVNDEKCLRISNEQRDTETGTEHG